MGRGDDPTTSKAPPRRNPFRQEISDTPSGYRQKRAEIQEQLKDERLMTQINSDAQAIEELLKASFSDFKDQGEGTSFALHESESQTFLNLEKIRQRYAAFLSEKLLEQIEDPYLQNRLDEVISEYQSQILNEGNRTTYSIYLEIDEKIFSRFLAKIKREMLLYELRQDSLERGE